MSPQRNPQSAVFYNENDAFPAQWLRSLIELKHLPDGVVDERSITDVRSDELRSFRQCHFFAGIGGWPYALELAGWPEDREVWTGSCPCQPLSSAGQRKGHTDERHLWPAFYRLIAERRPSTIFGEQVASADGREWLAGVRADLEALGYAVGAADLCAAGVGAPHIRQRLFWVVDARPAFGVRRTSEQRSAVAYAPERHQETIDNQRSGATGGMGDTNVRQPEQLARNRTRPNKAQSWRACGEPARSSSAFWAGAEWLPCLDGKARRIEPGTFPLANGVPARVGRLRGYGNAIVPQVAAEFVKAFLDCSVP